MATKPLNIASSTHLLIDVDDTLYSPEIPVWPRIEARIYDYMHKRVGLDPKIIPALRNRLFNTYGTTLRGLQIEYGVDFNDYLLYVHDVDLSDLLLPDPVLQQVLANLPQEKWLFTNASRLHAQHCMESLGVSPYFAGIIGVEDTQPWCKPHPEAFHAALALCGSPLPEQTVFFDDRSDNLDTAAQLGMGTVLVTPENQPGYTCIRSLSLIPSLLSKS